MGKNALLLILAAALAIGGWWAHAALADLRAQVASLEGIAAPGKPRGHALDFGVVPTGVSTKGSASSDAGPEETPPWKDEVSYPRLIALLTVAFWGADWSTGEELTTLPQEVTLPATQHPIGDAEIRALPFKSIWIAYERLSFYLPEGFSGSAIEIDELLLYCRDREHPCQLYIHRPGGAWWLYATILEYRDLELYEEYQRRNPHLDIPW